MGESWSDLVALEYLHAHGYVPPTARPWTEGPYVTGNKQTGIRDYALDDNPLNYSDVGFDLTGPEVHADGEIWNAVNYDVRQALVKKYDAQFPSSDRALQLRCADGVTGSAAPEAPLPADLCPGNRRWIQIMFDAFLLQQGDTSMLTARDAYLAADRMRFGGANQAELWAAFAKRGMGAVGLDGYHRGRPAGAGLRLAAGRQRDGDVRATNAAADATFYIGHFEARATPVPTPTRDPTASSCPAPTTCSCARLATACGGSS